MKESKITHVEYSRLITTGNYSNEKFGATAEVGERDPNEVILELKASTTAG